MVATRTRPLDFDEWLTDLRAVEEKMRASKPKPPPVAFHKDKCPTDLRVVDPMEDEGVWAIVDDGCNSCTHSREWRLNAEEKWAKRGFKCYLKDGKVTKFTGIGSSPSTGKWKLPAGFLLNESGLVLPGALGLSLIHI